VWDSEGNEYLDFFGGILTLVGTSTNLLVNSLLIGQKMPPLHIFDLFPVGIAIVAACGVAMVLTGTGTAPMRIAPK